MTHSPTYQSQLESKAWADAIPLIQAALQAEPRNPGHWFALGECHQQLGNFGSAVDSFLACFLASGQSHEEAAHRAGHLIKLADPNEGLGIITTEPMAAAVEMMRLKFEERPPTDYPPSWVKQWRSLNAEA